MNEKRKVKNVIVKCGADFFLPVAIMYGIYVILHCNTSPGGGFQGGVLVASAIMLVYLGYGSDIMKKVFNSECLHRGEALAEALYVLVAFCGLVFGLVFCKNIIFNGGFYTSELATLMNDVVGLDVTTGVGCLLLALVTALKPGEEEEEEDDE